MPSASQMARKPCISLHRPIHCTLFTRSEDVERSPAGYSKQVGSNALLSGLLPTPH